MYKIYILNMSMSEAEIVFKSHCFIKSVTAGFLAGNLDNYINYAAENRRNPNILGRNFTFGVLVGGSIIAADYAAPSFTNLVPIKDTALYSGKTLEHRLVEVGLGAGTSIVLNRVVGASGASLISQVGIIVLSDVIGEYVADYVKSTPLSYLQ